MICFIIPTGGIPTGKLGPAAIPDWPWIAEKGCKAVRRAHLRCGAGTVNPTAELWGGLRWFYLEATVSIKLVIAPHGVRSRPVLK